MPSGRTLIGERLLLPFADDPEGPVSGLVGMTLCEGVAAETGAARKLAAVQCFPVSQIP